MAKPEITKTLAATSRKIWRDAGHTPDMEVLIKASTGTIPSGVGIVTISDTEVQSTSLIYVTPTASPTGTLYVLSSDITAGTSFKVRSTATETSATTFNYMIIN